MIGSSFLAFRKAACPAKVSIAPAVRLEKFMALAKVGIWEWHQAAG